MLRSSPVLPLLLLVVACGSPSVDDAPPAAGHAAVDLDGWAEEHIPLPPDFAPGLPSGDERLLFAPGMFDADAEDFWSYAFVMRLDEGGLDAQRLHAILELYYDGLIRAVAGSRDAAFEGEPATLRVTQVAEGHFTAAIVLFDAFVTLAPIHLYLIARVDEARPDSTRLRITASPQHDDHPVWHRLDAAAASIVLEPATR